MNSVRSKSSRHGFKIWIVSCREEIFLGSCDGAFLMSSRLHGAITSPRQCEHQALQTASKGASRPRRLDCKHVASRLHAALPLASQVGTIKTSCIL
mmetsp:Transcript_92262/g.164179  ORF Transcript_92262/g.164179 Transcript_92262/m.164179 type:complete len:96 (+) Transcript_92262:491-778(+)